ncbi:RNA polymerase sigma factor [Ferruginibacter lapsinanis]|uniref:RNA polymerase sigma factor n=1 Tax=Ferruginibacter lapsinanis TaxID=563172 RepID=UPI001E370F6C|nr:RNA polymerase sigma factor [Ferruginibacter lapsinanis]UEG49425.1 RNA polymerase sigma factor [Ferruginibacter lapsinanis]
MTEHELIAGLRNADESAFRELVLLFQDKVFNTSLGFLQHEADAEDIAQEVFIQIFRSIHQFNGLSGLSTWIYRITVTKSLDHLRSKKRKKRIGYIRQLFGFDNAPLHELTDFNHPGVQLDKKEDAAMLFKLIAQLPENQQAAFILNKVEELSYREIAAILTISESAVDSLLQRAKQNLRKMIKNNGADRRF